MIYVYIGIAIIVVLVIFMLIAYNKIVSLNNLVKEAFSTMDVYLKKRWDLIPNLVDCVKGYTEHEKNTLESVVNLRNAPYSSMNESDKIKIGEEIAKIMVLSEAYPDLKSSENFMNLSKDLVKIEDDIENARKYYNGTVRNYNTAILSFPINIVAKIFGFKEQNMFEATENERENVKVEMN